MAKLREVATAAELMKLLEESGILKPAELRKAADVAAETNSCRLLARRLVALKIITRWQAGQLLVGWTKLRLGKYLLRSQIGRGHFGRVFLAEHTQLEREVAIKTLSRRFTQYPEIVERFLADAREVAALDHRNIVHVFDVDSDDDQFYMVMEYVRGCDLRRRVEQTGPLAIEVAANCLGQAAAGLAHAHQRRVIHRDLQPANLMIDDRGAVKIVGWGIGRLAGLRRNLDTRVQDQPDSSNSGYVAPEQLEDNDRSDARSDIDALGCTAYYLLTGQTPPPANSQQAVRPASSAVTSTDIAELRSDIPDDFATVIRRMMACDPADRYASAADVMQALQPWAQNQLEAVPLPGPAASESSDGSFEWVPENKAASRPSTPTETTESANTRDVSAASRPSRWSLGGAVAVLALMGLGLSTAFIHWLSKPDTAASWSATDRRQPATSPLPRVRKRDRSGTPGTGADASSPLPLGGRKSTDPAADTKQPPPAPGDGGAEKNPAVPTPRRSQEPPPSKEPPPSRASRRQATEPPPSRSRRQARRRHQVNRRQARRRHQVNRLRVRRHRPPCLPPKPIRPLPPNHLPIRGATCPPPSTYRLWFRMAGAPAVAEPFDLGPLSAPSTDAFTVSLLGGTTAGARGAHFEFSPRPDTDHASWQFSLVEDNPAGSVTRVVAALRSEENHLRFQWDPAVQEIEGAAQLSNCVLRLTSGAHTHDVRLRKPQRAEPLRIDLRKQSAPARTKVPTPPDSKQVRFQITAVEEPLPRSYTLRPPEPIGVNDVNLQISLGADPESQVLLLELTPELRTVFQLKCEAYFRVKSDAEPVVWALEEVAGSGTAGGPEPGGGQSTCATDP